MSRGAQGEGEKRTIVDKWREQPRLKAGKLSTSDATPLSILPPALALAAPSPNLPGPRWEEERDAEEARLASGGSVTIEVRTAAKDGGRWELLHSSGTGTEIFWNRFLHPLRLRQIPWL